MPRKRNAVAKARDRQADARAIIPLIPQMTVTYAPGIGNTAAGWFGPLTPMQPVAPPDVAGRRFDFPNGYNLNTRPRTYENIGFGELRALAENYDLLRLVIETRKDQIERSPWTIRPKEENFGPGKGEASAALLARAKEITEFFRKPDKTTGWKPWLRALLEDMLVIDAATLFRRRTRGGSLYSLDLVDGATIVPKINAWGRQPLPPDTAYQQVLKGLPAVDYTSLDLIYKPRNIRTNRVYGYSPVEQIVMTVNIALRRQLWQLQYYTEGNVPDALIGVPETWTPDQIIQFQNAWDALFEGNAAQKRHAKFVPGGVAKTYIPTKEPELKNVFDEWLARVVCYAFSISAQPFVTQINRGEADMAKLTADSEGLAPTRDWVKDLITDIMVDDFGETDLEFAWVEGRSDPTEEATRITKLTGSGLMRLNEGRKELGLAPDPDPMADKLGSMTSQGFVPLEVSGAPRPDPASIDPATGQPIKSTVAVDGEAGKGELAPGKKPEVGKSADLPFVKGATRRLPPVKPSRVTRRAFRSLRATITKTLKAVSKDVAKQVREQLLDVAKADETEDERQKRIDDLAQKIANAVNLDGLDVLIDATAEQLENVVKDTAGRVLAQLGVDDDSKLVDQVNELAVEKANERAAELVGKRYVDGELVDNPNAEYAITDATREDIRRVIADGLDENIGLDEITANIEDATGFSEDRADLIARTEIARANSDAALESYRGASTVGVSVKKEWILGANPCPICEDNAADGAIDIDEPFSSGDDAPPAHPNCECAVSPVVDDGEDDQPDDTE